MNVDDPIEEELYHDEEELYHDEDTMSLVYGSLLVSGLSVQQITDAVEQMQGVGIVFREVPGNNRRAKMIAQAQTREA